jgi:hypothetical protein
MRTIGSTQSRRQLRDAGRSLFAGSAQVAPIMSVSNRIGKEHVFCAHPGWVWLVAASFIACFVVGFCYLPFKLPQANGLSIKFS